MDVFSWTFRRNEKDVINLYDSLSDIMRLATGGDMLNFGYWDNEISLPILAQKKLCSIFAKKAQLESGQQIVDIGSGLGAPAFEWHNAFSPIEITSVNINFEQLQYSLQQIRKLNDVNKNFQFINSTATILPFGDESIDRVLSLESAQHFKPLKNFFAESYRILRKGGILAISIPVVTKKFSMLKLGLLSMTWPSEHYSIDFVKLLLKQVGFSEIETQKIGSNVYEPLADYYIKNRESIKPKILKQYSAKIEKILAKSIITMKDVSQKKIIDYLLVTYQK